MKSSVLSGLSNDFLDLYVGRCLYDELLSRDFISETGIEDNLITSNEMESLLSFIERRLRPNAISDQVVHQINNLTSMARAQIAQNSGDLASAVVDGDDDLIEDLLGEVGSGAECFYDQALELFLSCFEQ